METTDKQVCGELVAVLQANGVRRAFVSPGSRNAPIIVALARCESIVTTVVVDERSAAFMAMGYASVAGEPVVLACTSGTALLNYAPAVAEAYYRRVPLIVVSADRPMEWIDQDDSQTIRQAGALHNYVKLSCDIPEPTTPNMLWYANRRINDAVLMAVTGRRAPVHINLQLDVPLNGMRDVPDDEPHRIVSCLSPRPDLEVRQARAMSDRLASPRKVMIVAGFYPPDSRLNKAIGRLAALPNVVVLTETVANLHGPHLISRIDSTLRAMTETDREKMRPDVVITLGGALVSRFIKDYLRSNPPEEHWHVGVSHTTIDCFRALTMRVEMDAGIFFQQLASAMQPHKAPSDYAIRWSVTARRAQSLHQSYVARAPWSDLKAFATFLPMIPRHWNIQYSNGTPIRYSQLFGDLRNHRTDCNRGVSGIDGCTSTAIGASMAYPADTTLLVTGDMSATYDVGAFSAMGNAPRLKLLVMNNGGGGIFRFVSSTASLAELDQYFVAPPRLPLADLCRGYGIAYYEASSEAELRSVFPQFAAHEGIALLSVTTPSEISAEVLKGYFKQI